MNARTGICLAVFLSLCLGAAFSVPQDELGLFGSDCRLLIRLDVKELLGNFPADLRDPLKRQLGRLVGRMRLDGMDSMAIGLREGFFSGDKGSLGIVVKGAGGPGGILQGSARKTISLRGLSAANSDFTLNELDDVGGFVDDKLDEKTKAEVEEAAGGKKEETEGEKLVNPDKEKEDLVRAAEDAGVSRRTLGAQVNSNTWVVGSLLAMKNFSDVINGKKSSGRSSGRLIRTIDEGGGGSVVAVAGSFGGPQKEKLFGRSALSEVLDAINVKAGLAGEGFAIEISIWPVNPEQVNLLNEMMHEILPAAARNDSTGFYGELAASMDIRREEGQVVVRGTVSKAALAKKLLELGDTMGIGIK